MAVLLVHYSHNVHYATKKLGRSLGTRPVDDVEPKTFILSPITFSFYFDAVHPLMRSHCSQYKLKVSYTEKLLSFICCKSHLALLHAESRSPVTDDFIAQLPQKLIVPSSHLQISNSVGEGKLHAGLTNSC